MKKVISILAMQAFALFAAQAQFLPGHLAVLRAGDGVMDLHLRQAPIFVDQFDPHGSNSAPSFTVPIPTNGPNLIFFNGHAATEGNLNRSADRRFLVFAGYGGMGLLESNGTPSYLDIPRGVCTVDASGTVQAYFYEGIFKDAKVNPRGAVADGAGNFWACGNAYGTLYYNPKTSPQPARFKSFPNSRAIKIINNVLYASMNVSDARVLDKLAGIYKFQTASNGLDDLPRKADAPAELVLAVSDDYAKTVGFDINPWGTIAYMADTVAGIQKYINTNGTWKFERNFSIPQTIPAKLNNNTGCFGLVVDFSGQAPVVYATTTEGYGSSVNSNRVVRILDNETTAAVVTIAQATSTNIAFRGIEFTPENGSPKVSEK
jgi:hypothetical protein